MDFSFLFLDVGFFPKGSLREVFFAEDKTVWVGTPDKHDGVVNVKSTRWAANHSNEDFWNQHNPDKDEIAPGKDQGGYNHFEMRNAKRNYTLPEVFNKGDENPPMRRVADWIFDNRSNF